MSTDACRSFLFFQENIISDNLKLIDLFQSKMECLKIKKKELVFRWFNPIF
jgi:hypothetical protein